ncbi:MAG TPA: hypothetical protein EYN05_00700 [Nitrospinaceae bacterium]|jgi:phosphoheptose isomerase|nr:hypothetical protein [Nitrospinaceae bacterium]
MIGKGGSAAVVSHILTDFINVAGLRASTLHESSLITCMANDYGYENVFSTSLDKIAKKDDILIAKQFGSFHECCQRCKYYETIRRQSIDLQRI